MELKVFQGCSILTCMYVMVDIWWNNGDKGCDMARVKTWNLILLCSLRGYFSLLNFEEYLGLTLLLLFSFFSFLRTRTQASFASTYQEINNKDC
jgi:hypothetical protein